jgi:hypothetical protein
MRGAIVALTKPGAAGVIPTRCFHIQCPIPPHKNIWFNESLSMSAVHTSHRQQRVRPQPHKQSQRQSANSAGSLSQGKARQGKARQAKASQLEAIDHALVALLVSGKAS